MKKKNIIKLVIVSVCGVILSGCGAKKGDPYKNVKPSKIYTIGDTALKKGDQKKAIQAFESLNSQYPFYNDTRLGNVGLIYAYYLDDNAAMTLASASRYLRLYPNTPEAVYAYYMQGIENYNSGRGFLQRYFPYDMSQHDPNNYYQAYNYFDKVILKYPHTVYAKDARRRMIYLKNVMAKYELNIAEYYYQMKAYVASASRAKGVIINYPRTTFVKSALELMYYDYKQLSLPQYASQINKVYQENYGVKLNGVRKN
jgi:outer membrane protein assembly factor BamD